MPIIPDPSSLMFQGITRAFRGLRQGDQRMLLVGAALVAIGWLRRTGGPERVLLHRQAIPEGSSVVVRYGHGDLPQVEVRKVPSDPT